MTSLRSGVKLILMKLHQYTFLILILSFFTSYSIAETKIKYKTYEKLPCKFNGARVTSTASPNPYISGGRAVCLQNKKSGYSGKMGTTIEIKRGTPVFAVKDMELVMATDYSSKFMCSPNNIDNYKKIKGTKYKTINHPVSGEKIKCRYPWDGLTLTFKTWDNDMVLYYHLMPDTPLVPGFGKGKCKIREFYKINIPKQRYKVRVNYDDCGGIKKKIVNKGEIIGYVGHATSDHISFNISPKQKGFLNSPEKKEHGLIWENYPKNPNAFLLPIMSKKYLKEIGYKK